ncbi:MAG TPA: class I SAM-dependent methyltransferase [Candidatus Dormibacteraeota bacterium]|nr:class I SAM-dependent methyltransferase [Candidatus Dormibacteraeota bacterium]
MTETDRIARAYEEMEARAGDRWSLANRGNRTILDERRQAFMRLLAAAGWIPLGDRRVLEVGSGTGTELAWLLELGARASNLFGVDLLAGRVAAASHTYPDIQFHQGNAEHLDFPNEAFDMVMAVTIFSSILDRRMAENVAVEIVRVLKPGGGLLWYDVRYDSVSNPNVKAVSRARIAELFPGLGGALRTVTLLPPLARRLGPATPVAYPALALAPPLRSHLVGLLRKARG